ncbi:MAG: DUF2865 domain-containing protein [Methyloceanibacter sp.]
MKTRHELWLASLAQRVGGPARLAMLALCGTAIAGAGTALAQDDQQVRCMQLQQELASAHGGGGREALPAIERQIQDTTRVFQGTKAAMEDAGCYERGFLIFGRGLVRSPKCLQMNDRVEDSRRQVGQLQQQRDAILSGGGNRRRQAELNDALARNGCGGARPQQARRDSGGGGLFGWFGRGGEEEAPMQPDQPVYRSIDPNGRYRSVCVRTCDGFFFPVSYSTYAGRLAQDAAQCQSSCAAPAELYVYRNPGQEIDQAISLNGIPYQELPAAFKYRQEYVKGCSCKEAEYNPTEIEAANQKAEAAPAPGAAQKAAAAEVPAPAPAAQPPQLLNLDVTGALPPQPQAAPEPQAAAPAEAAPVAETVPAEAAPPPAPQPQQSSIAKRTPAPAQ